MALLTTIAPAIAVLFLISLTNGQLRSTPAPPSCSDVDTESGGEYKPHETYCDLFYRCLNGRNGKELTVQSCPAGTVYNTLINNCDHLSNSEVAQMPCSATTNGSRIPSKCSNEYYQCNSVSGWSKQVCASGQRYDMTTGNCVTGQGVDHPLCFRPVGNSSSECTLYASDDGDICKYKQRLNATRNANDPVLKCAEGTSFNASTCGCHNYNATCTHNDIRANKWRPDPECLCSFSCDFTTLREQTGTPQAQTCKPTPGPLNDTIQLTNAAVVNGMAQLRSDSTSPNPSFIYVYALNNNELSRSFALCTTFRLLNATNTPVTIFSNEYYDHCQSTYSVTATLAGSSYTVNVTVESVSVLNARNRIRTIGTATGTLALPNANNFMQTCMYFNSTLYLRMADKGLDGTTTGQQVQHITGTSNLGSTLLINQCGIRYGNNYNADFKQIRWNEGCSNYANLAY